MRVEEYLIQKNANYNEFEFKKLSSIVAKEINDGKVVGWFQGKLEFGPELLAIGVF